MFDSVWLNLASIVFGLFAWSLPVINLMQNKKTDYKKIALLSVVSVSFSAISLLMVIAYTNYLVDIEDWSALMDTSSAFLFVSTVLLIITIILNAVTLVIKYRTK